MSATISKTKRLVLPLMAAATLGGCAVYEPLPAGSYVVNADGTRTHVQGVYTCPAGYTCTYPAAPGQVTSYAPAPVYYGYPPTYVGPSPYIWPPLFFGMGYYWGGGYHHHHHHPRPPIRR